MKRLYSIALMLGVLLVPLWYYGRTKTDHESRFFWRELLFHESEKREETAVMAAAAEAEAQAEKAQAQAKEARQREEEERARVAEIQRAAESKRQWEFVLSDAESGIAMFDSAAEASDKWFREIAPLQQSEDFLYLLRFNSDYIRAFERFYKIPLSRKELSTKLTELRRVREIAENALRDENAQNPPNDELNLARSIRSEFADARSVASESRNSINTLIAIMQNRVPETVESAKAMLHMRELLEDLHMRALYRQR